MLMPDNEETLSGETFREHEDTGCLCVDRFVVYLTLAPLQLFDFF
jgi:hypothetical protein